MRRYDNYSGEELREMDKWEYLKLSIEDFTAKVYSLRYFILLFVGIPLIIFGGVFVIKRVISCL